MQNMANLNVGGSQPPTFHFTSFHFLNLHQQQQIISDSILAGVRDLNRNRIV